MQQADADLTPLDRAIVNAFQGGFPVAERPFEPAAAALRERGVEVAAAELAERIRHLDEAGVLSRFGPLVNAEAIGGTATLVAMHAPEDRFEAIAEAVNAHPEVAHNYEREHEHLNVWFVVSVADPDRVDAVLAAIEDETGQTTYNMPKQREFRVEAKFPVDGPLRDAEVDLSGLGPTVHAADAGADPEAEAGSEGTLTPAERDLVLAVQDGLPITETPYRDVAVAIAADPAWVRRTLKRFLAEGKVRRIGVVPNHYALGYTENGMTVWDVPDEVVPEVGPAVAALPFVTHCYRRPRHEGVWPYNFFAMTHGRDEAESERRVREVRETMAEHWDVGEDDWETLFSTRILKKTGIRLDERANANTERASGSDPETDAGGEASGDRTGDTNGNADADTDAETTADATAERREP